MRCKAELFCALLACLLLGGCAPQAEVVQTPAAVSPSPLPEIHLPEHREAGGSRETRLYHNGLLLDRAYERDGVLFVSPETLGELGGEALEVRIDADSFAIESANLSMRGEKQQQYMQANHRYLFSPEGYLVEEGRLYLSQAVLERVFGVTLTVYGEEPRRLELKDTKLQILPGGEGWYELNHDAETLYWLPRVIYAESKAQPMEGLIGVGNVVLNRVNSPDFPDTVLQVIFDRKYAVQFAPAVTKGILDTPDERSTVAACLCLEGYSTVGDSMYFVNPEKGNDRWFREALRFVCTYGEHDFYA